MLNDGAIIFYSIINDKCIHCKIFWVVGLKNKLSTDLSRSVLESQLKVQPHYRSHTHNHVHFAYLSLYANPTQTFTNNNYYMISYCFTIS